MIKKLLLSITLLGGLVFFTSSTLSDNGKAGKTNSPGETTCVNSCHNSYALNAGPGSISISSPGMSSFVYTPGQTYDMTVTVAQSGIGMFGVGIEALLASGNNGGTFTITDAVSTRIRTITVSGVVRNNITHQLNGGVAPNTKDFNFKWTAPAAGSGNVTFYFSGVAANGTGNENGDYVYNSSQVITESCTPPAQPNTITGGQTMCEGSNGNYSVPAVSGATSYIWTLPSGWSGTSTTNSITATAGSMSGNITVAAMNGCGTSTVQSMMVTCNPAPAQPVINSTQSAVDTLFGTYNWPCQWYFNGSPISGATNQTYVPTQNGTYTVTVTDGNGCSSTSANFLYATLGITEANSSELLSVFPAPATDFISVSVGPKLINGELTIMDVKGNTVMKRNITDAITRVELDGIAEGVYFAVATNGAVKNVTRFFVSK